MSEEQSIKLDNKNTSSGLTLLAATYPGILGVCFDRKLNYSQVPGLWMYFNIVRLK